MILSGGSGFAGEFSGFVGGQVRYFPTEPLQPGQKDQSVSFVAQPEYFHEFEAGHSFVFVPFFRLDDADEERTHFDVRELNFFWSHEDFELRVGVGKVFWGATEILHLVNIVNQIDLVENVDLEDFLGQPMLNLSLSRDWGALDLFVLPYFRERTFAGEEGRIRGALVVDAGQAKFESSAEEWHTDGVIRYSKVVGDLDFGIYHFYGTGREPTFLPGRGNDGAAVLVPFYELIHQTGSDMTYVVGDWLWKFEGLHRSGQADSFFALTTGYEYTFIGIFGAVDLGIITEYFYDERDQSTPSSLENDIGLGFRLALNDEQGTEFLFSWIQGLGASGGILNLEAGRRIGNNVKLSLEVRGFFDLPPDNFLFQQRNDDYLQLDLEYYF